MQLDRITITIRNRSPWEAVDLGFALIRRDWLKLFGFWAVFALMIYLPIAFLFTEHTYWLPLLIFWWLKPLYDRFILYQLSHQLFDDKPDFTTSLKALPQLLRETGLFAGLLWRRFSLSRSFTLPIWQLEGIKGKQRAKRQKTLHLFAQSHSIWLTIACIHIEWILLFGLYGILYLFLPESMQGNFIEEFAFSSNISNDFWGPFLNNSVYVLIVIILEPFYVAAGFMLYLNRRTQLEGWDIELTFRNMGKRLHALQNKTLNIAALCLGSLLIFSLSSINTTALANNIPAEADEYIAAQRLAANESKTEIEQIMQNDAFSDTQTIMVWVPKKKDKEEEKEDYEPSWFKSLQDILSPVVTLISWLIESALWILVISLLILLFLSRDKWLHLVWTKHSKNKKYQAPDILFGMDVRAESLPDDLISAVKQLWQQEQHRESLSLLYRGTLAFLLNQDQLQLESSHTEGDILQLAQQRLSLARLAYLEKLTLAWQNIAYAHRLPQEHEMHYLLQHWHDQFATAEDKKPAGDMVA